MPTLTNQNTTEQYLLSRLKQQQEALLTVGRKLIRYDGDTAGAVRIITETAARVFDIERASMWFLDSSRRTLLCHDLFEATPGHHSRGSELSAEKCPSFFSALETLEFISAENAITDVHTHELTESYLKPNGIAAILCVPIWSGGELVGVLCFEHAGNAGNVRKFYNDEINTAIILSGMAGSVIEIELRLQKNRNTQGLLSDKLVLWNILFEHSRDGMVVLDQDGSVYQANKKYADMLGYSVEEIQNLHVWDWDCNFSREEILGMLRMVGTPGSCFETKQRRKDGTTIDVELSNNGAVYKGKKLIFCIVRDITERKRLHEQLNQQKIIVENSKTVVFQWSAEPGWPIDFVSDNVRQFGYDPEELLSGAMDFASMIYPDDLERVAAEVKQYNESGAESFEQEYRIVCADGRVCWIYDRTVVERNDDGDAHHFQGIVIDITERKEAEQKLRESEERLNHIASQVPGVLFQFRIAPDGTRSFPYLSEGTIELGGRNREELSGDPKFIMSLIHPEDIDDVEASISESAKTMQPLNIEFRIRHRDGSFRWISSNSIPFRTPDGSVTWNGILMDITERKLADEKIRILATTDGLTGINNRQEFTRILENEIERAKRYGTPLSLIMYDIDHFKYVNDNFGHDVGDEVLCTFVRLVNENIRGIDVAGRWGGEEFIVLLPQTDLTAAMNVAEKLRQVIDQNHFDKVGSVTASFGVVEFTPQDDIDSLLKRADKALYQAKNRGRNRVETADTEGNDRI